MTGEVLRSAREARGLGLEEVAHRARIPVRYLRALEDGDTSTLPSGPFYTGYRRQYLAFLGLEERAAPTPVSPREDPTADLEDPSNGLLGDPDTVEVANPHRVDLEESTLTIPRHEEVPVVRLVLIGFAITLAALLGLRLGAALLDQRLSPSTDASTSSAASATAMVAGQVVSLRTVEPVRVRMEVDGETVHDGRIAAGATLKGTGTEVILDIGDLSVVTVKVDGTRVEPLHNLTSARRLRFVKTAP